MFAGEGRILLVTLSCTTRRTPPPLEPQSLRYINYVYNLAAVQLSTTITDGSVCCVCVCVMCVV